MTLGIRADRVKITNTSLIKKKRKENRTIFFTRLQVTRQRTQAELCHLFGEYTRNFHGILALRAAKPHGLYSKLCLRSFKSI